MAHSNKQKVQAIFDLVKSAESAAIVNFAFDRFIKE